MNIFDIDFGQFTRKARHSTGALSEAGRAGLAAWYAADPARTRGGRAPFRWAFISRETR